MPELHCSQGHEWLHDERDERPSSCPRCGQPALTLVEAASRTHGLEATRAVTPEPVLPEADEQATTGPAAIETLSPASTSSAVGDQIRVPGYQILSEVGRGGMGVVYKARQLNLNRLVALKTILAGVHAGPQHLSRFRTEAEAVARLQHPNIVQIHEVGEHDGRPYLSLEFVEGGSLAQRLHDAGPLSHREAAELIETLARAIHFAHQRGIVHRDLKPANILLQIADCGMRIADSQTSARDAAPGFQSAIRNPKSAIPKITDFGLAKQLEAETGQTRSGDVLGTPSYMAPEQAGGRVKQIGPATDVYALGAILYELLGGKPPFQADSTMETLQKVLHEEPAPLSRSRPNLPRDLETICLKCLQKEPAKRYQTATGLADDLRRFLNGESIEARPAGFLERLVKKAKRRPGVTGLVAGAVAGIAVLLTMHFLITPLPRPPGDTYAAASADAAKAERARLQGEWEIVSSTADGKPLPVSGSWTFEEDHLLITGLDEPAHYSIKIDRVPRTIDYDVKLRVLDPAGGGLHDLQHSWKAIYELKGDELRVGTGKEPASRPVSFDTAPRLLVMKRRSTNAAAPELALVPADATAFIHVRLESLWTSDEAKAFRDGLKREYDKELTAFQQVLGFPIDQLERVTIAMMGAKGEEAALILVGRTPLPKEHLLKSLLKNATSATFREHEYHRSEPGEESVYFFNERTVAFGTRKSIERLLGDKPADGPLAPALRLAKAPHHVVAGVRVIDGRFFDIDPEKLARLEPLKPLLKARTLGVTLDFGSPTQARIEIDFANEADARAAEASLKPALAAVKRELSEATDVLAKDFKAAVAFADSIRLLRAVEAALDAATGERRTNMLVVSAQVQTTSATLGRAALDGLTAMRFEAKSGFGTESPFREATNFNLRRIGLALIAYYNEHKAFPPAAICDKDGRPLLSWRVALLAYLGDKEKELYKKFKLDEPWDSPANKPLLEQMPVVYDVLPFSFGDFPTPDGQPPKRTTTTHYQAIVGPGAGFEGTRGLGAADFKDGRQGTLLIVEAAEPVPWTRPADVVYDPDKPLPKLGMPRMLGFDVITADGSVFYLPHDKVTDKRLRAMITRSGGEPIDLLLAPKLKP